MRKSKNHYLLHFGLPWEGDALPGQYAKCCIDEKWIGHWVPTSMHTHCVLIECGALRQRQLRNFVLAASKTENKIAYTFSYYILFIFIGGEL